MAFHKSWLREIMLKHGRPLKQQGRGRKRRQMCAEVVKAGDGCVSIYRDQLGRMGRLAEMAREEKRHVNLKPSLEFCKPHSPTEELFAYFLLILGKEKCSANILVR